MTMWPLFGTPTQLPNGKIWRAGSTCSRGMGCSSIIRWVRPTVVAPSPTRSATTERRFPICTASYIAGFENRNLRLRPKERRDHQPRHLRCMIGFQGQRRVVRFDRRYIDERAHAVLSGGDLASTNE